MPVPAFEVMPSLCASFTLPPLPSLHLCVFLTVFCPPFSLCLHVVGDVCAAVSEDGLPTQEPASRAVAERPAPQPAQRSSCHDGPSLLQHRESALPSPLPPIAVSEGRKREEGWWHLQYAFFSSEVRHRNERRGLSQKMQ